MVEKISNKNEIFKDEILPGFEECRSKERESVENENGNRERK